MRDRWRMSKGSFLKELKDTVEFQKRKETILHEISSYAKADRFSNELSKYRNENRWNERKRESKRHLKYHIRKWQCDKECSKQQKTYCDFEAELSMKTSKCTCNSMLQIIAEANYYEHSNHKHHRYHSKQHTRPFRTTSLFLFLLMLFAAEDVNLVLLVKHAVVDDSDVLRLVFGKGFISKLI